MTQKISYQPPRSLLYAYLALLCWAPLPLGSNRPWAWSLLEAGTFLLAIAWLIYFSLGRAPLTRAFRQAWPALLLFSAWLAYTALQFMPIPADLLMALSPKLHELHLTGLAGGTMPAYLTISLDPAASLDEWYKSLAYILIFCLTLLLLYSRRDLRLFAWVLVTWASAEAVLGALTALSGMENSFSGSAKEGMGFSTGTYINHAHFSFYLVMNLSIGMGLLITDMLGTQPGITLRQQIRNFTQWIMSPKMLLRLLLTLMLISLILSRSRMGSASFLFGMTGALLLTLWLGRSSPRPIIRLVGGIIVLEIVIFGTWFSIDQLLERFMTLSAASEMRDDVIRDMLPMIKEFWLTGLGKGAFYTLFPSYHGSGIIAFFDHAHNDYLEILVETGFIGFFSVGGAVIVSLAAAIRAQALRSTALMRGVSFTGIMAVIAMLAHSLVDFNMQIPANSFYFAVILALCWISLYARRGGGSYSDSSVI